MRVPFNSMRHAPVISLLEHVAWLRFLPKPTTVVMGGTVVVAPHPDDEVLGCSAVLLGASATVVHVTDGVPPWTAATEWDSVRSARRTESERAWAKW